MQISKCPVCGLMGFLTFRYTKYENLKYPYIGHYDPKKKSRRSWCSIKITDPKNRKIEAFWQLKYDDLIKKTLVLRRKSDDMHIWIKPLNIAFRLLQKHGYNRNDSFKKINLDILQAEDKNPRQPWVERESLLERGTTFSDEIHKRYSGWTSRLRN